MELKIIVLLMFYDAYQSGSLSWGWICTNRNLCCLCCGWWKVSLTTSLFFLVSSTLPICCFLCLLQLLRCYVSIYVLSTGVARFNVRSICRSLIANLSAANCYKSEHLKRPENWVLGTLFLLFYWILPSFCYFGLIIH